MNWKERYSRKQIGTIKGIPIYKNGFYIINTGDDVCTTIPVNGGFVVQISGIDVPGGRIWFDGNLNHGAAYIFSIYEGFLVREATKQETIKWKKIQGKV